MRRGFIPLLFILAATGSAAHALDAPRPSQVVALMLSAPDEELDFGRAQLAIDRLVRPSIDAADVARELDALVIQARMQAGEGASDEAKINAVRRVIYQSGPWNDARPFSYDHNDPLGSIINNKLLATYLDTRRGNCVSMPTLFLILADRLGLNVGLSTAPLHVFVRYADPQGRAFNIETTSGANLARMAWYRQNLPMTDRALESGLYMRTLTKRESIALMAVTIVEWLVNGGQYQEAIEVADVILRHDPLNGHALVKRGDAYGQLLRAEFIERYTNPAAIPTELRPRYSMLAARNAQDFERAESLGWTAAQ